MPVVTGRAILEEIACRALNAPEATRPVIPERLQQVRGSGRAKETSGREAAPHDPSPPPISAAPPGGPPDSEPPGPPPWEPSPSAAPPLSAADSDKPSQMGGAGRKRDARKGSGRQATARRNRGGGNGGAPPPPPADQRELDRRLAFFPLTDLGNAERFRERQRGRLIWCAAVGWLWWDGRRWSRQGADGQVAIAAHLTVRSIQDEAASICGSDYDTVIGSKGRGDDRSDVMYSDQLKAWGRDSETNAKLNLLAKQAAAYLEVQPEQLDADPFAINCRNGTIFVRKPADEGGASRTGVWPRNVPHRKGGGYLHFRPHDPGDFITKLAPVDYDPNAPRPRFDAFLADVQPLATMRRQLAAWCGYSMTGDISEQKLCVFYGTGKNGKSVFVDVCCFVAGDYSGTTPIETFLDQGRARGAGQATPDLANLPGVRMLRTSEPNKGARLDEGLIKLATGGESMKVRHLNKDYFDLYPIFKLMISGNHRPQISGADEGIWRRIVLVPWRVTVPEEKRVPFGQLVATLRNEGSGILNWMLGGLADWLDHGLSLAAETQEATAEYRRDSDQLGRFLEACTERAPGERVQSSVLHDVFCAWCAANALTAWKGRSFSDAMTERGFKKDKSSVMFWLDIRLLKSRGDFVDNEGRPKLQGDAAAQREAFNDDWNDGGLTF